MAAIVIAAGGLAAIGLTGATALASSAPAGGSTIAGTHPSWAVRAREITSPDTATSMSVRVYLAGRNPAGLAAYATAVSTPGGSSYHRFLSTTEVRQRYGPTSAQVSAVKAWVTGAGLSVTAVTQHYLAVRGPIRALDRAFRVQLARFRTPTGAVATAPLQDATVPAAARSAVLTVTGLDTQAVLMHPALPKPGPGYYTAGPCSKYYGQKHATSKPAAYGKHVPWAICGYKPGQLRGAYGLGDSTLTGRGVTVAIVDAYASPTMRSDANTYSEKVGERPFGLTQYRQILPSSFSDLNECGGSGWYQEQTLDVEAVHAMAPGAKVLYVGASSCAFGPLLDSLIKIVDNHLANVVTNSWTGLEGELGQDARAAYTQVFEQGAVEGIGFDFASGDCGYNNPKTGCGEAEGSTANQVEFPPSSPWVTAVGGTTLAIGQHNNYDWETGWGDQVVPQQGKHWKPAPPGRYPADYAFGGGGGTSTLYRQPAYQAGVVPDALATRLPTGHLSATAMRVVPDVAMDADPATGFLFGQTVQLRGGKFGFQLSRIGGTSLASPLFAGLEADAAQSTGPRSLGFANPVLYSMSGSQAFHDVTDSPLGRGVRIAAARNEWFDSTTGTGPIQTSLYTFGLDGSGTAALRATTGFDNVTGLGSPAAGFVSVLGGS
jgi:subtilase family serine protease